MKIKIDEVPLSKNDYIKLHWSKKADYKEMIGWLILEQHRKMFKDPKYIDDIGDFAENVTVTFDIYFKVKRRRDIQNYLGGGLISWLDALVDNSIIADDCYECIGQPQVHFYIDKDHLRTEIIIEGR